MPPSLGYFHVLPPLIFWPGLGSYLQMGLILGLPNEMCNNFEGITKIRWRHATYNSSPCKILKICLCIMQLDASSTLTRSAHFILSLFKPDIVAGGIPLKYWILPPK